MHIPILRTNERTSERMRKRIDHVALDNLSKFEDVEGRRDSRFEIRKWYTRLSGPAPSFPFFTSLWESSLLFSVYFRSESTGKDFVCDGRSRNFIGFIFVSNGIFFLTIVFYVLLLIRRCFQYRHLAVSSCPCISIYLPSARESSEQNASVIL